MHDIVSTARKHFGQYAEYFDTLNANAGPYLNNTQQRDVIYNNAMRFAYGESGIAMRVDGESLIFTYDVDGDEYSATFGPA